MFGRFKRPVSSGSGASKGGSDEDEDDNREDDEGEEEGVGVGDMLVLPASTTDSTMLCPLGDGIMKYAKAGRPTVAPMRLRFWRVD